MCGIDVPSNKLSVFHERPCLSFLKLLTSNNSVGGLLWFAVILDDVNGVHVFSNNILFSANVTQLLTVYKLRVARLKNTK